MKNFILTLYLISIIFIGSLFTLGIFIGIFITDFLIVFTSLICLLVIIYSVNETINKIDKKSKS